MPQLIKTMQLLNYSPDLEGMCFGIAAMATQATLRKGNEVFANRIRFIQNCTETEIETIKNSERDDEQNFNKKLDLMYFFDGISMYQGVDGVNNDFKSIASDTQNINDTIKIIKSKALENDDKFAHPEIKMKLVNAYTRESFLHFIKAIKKHFGQQPFSIITNHFPMNHATQIGFDKKNWLSTNHDFILLGEDSPEDLEKIVDNVFLPERYGSTERIVAVFDILLPEAVNIDLKPLEEHDFSTNNLTDSFEKEMLPHILACYLRISRYNAYFDILQKTSSLTLTENEKIALIESKNSSNSTVLHIAASVGEFYILKQILKTIDYLSLSFETKISMVNKKNDQNISVLYYAAQSGHTEVVKLLLDLGKSIDDQRLKADFLHAGRSALLVATNQGHTAIVYELIQAILTIENKAARNECLLARTHNGMSALSIAAQNGYIDIVCELIKAISSIEDHSVKIEALSAIGNKGESALFVAAKNGHENVVSVLVEAISAIEDKEARIALLTSRNENGESVLFIAERRKHENIVKLLRSTVGRESWLPIVLTLLETQDLSPDNQTEQTLLRLLATAVHDLSPDNLTDFFDKEMVSHLVTSFLRTFRYDSYLDLLQKISSLTLTESRKISLIEFTQRDNSTALHCVASDGESHILRQILGMIDSLGLSFETKISILNKKNNQDISALYYAAQNGHTEVVKILLDLSTSINDQSLKADFLHANGSALLVAANQGHTIIVYELIKAILSIENNAARNACLFARTYNGKSALTVAAQNGHIDIVCELIKVIFSVENQDFKIEELSAVDISGESVLFAAVKNGHENVVKVLIKAISAIENKEARIALLTSTNKKGESALSIAEQGKHENIVKLLRTSLEKERQASINLNPLEVHDFSLDNLIDFSDKETLSHILASSKDILRYDSYLDILQNVSSLPLTDSEKLALIEFTQKDSSTVLHRIACDGESRILSQILNALDELGLSFETKMSIINKKSNDGLSALYYAAQKGHTEVVKILLDLSTSIDDQSLKADFLHAGKSALLAAVENGYTNIANEFIKAILSIENKAVRNKCILAKTKGGLSALFTAAQNGYIDIVRELIKAISSIENQDIKIEELNALDYDGESALFVAAENGHASVVQMLVEAISSIEDREIRLALLTSTNKAGESALSIAEQGKHENIVNLLRTAIKKEKRLLLQKNCLNFCAVS